ncbi:hypothetical protein ACTSKR_01565 [Chitinibacteraceae bacterium HSL-7]
MRLAHQAIHLTLLLGSVATLIWSNNEIVSNRTPQTTQEDLNVALPLPVQLALASGDRYLAANINVFRAFMVESAHPDQSIVATQAKLQEQASFFNPAHEDNYYVAAATLAWQDHLDSAQSILFSAINSRPKDLYPPFYYGFNLRFFQKQNKEAARWIEVAASRADGANRQALTAMAARWYESGVEAIEGVRILQVMAASTKDIALHNFLLQRKQRLEGLISLRNAVHQYMLNTGRSPAMLQALVDSHILPSLPIDPTGIGYELDEHGIPQLAKAKRNNQQ